MFVFELATTFSLVLRQASAMLLARALPWRSFQPPRAAAVSLSRSLQAGFCQSPRRSLQSSTRRDPVPDFAFAFDIDGVLVRGSKALPGASDTLSWLQSAKIPFILLTNGGGYPEERRAEKLSKELQVPLDRSMIVQSHTPFEDLNELKDKTVLVVGGVSDHCRTVALQYGFQTVVTPSDILAQHPTFWPFSTVFKQYHESDANPRPLPKPINPSDPANSLKIDAIFVFNDPRDWALDTTAILDCLLSKQGVLGTLSPKNNNPDLPNRGYQGDGQPSLYFSNPDLWFASAFPLPRLGQGGFRHAFEGVWAAVTGGVELQKTIIGKPHRETYEFAEKRLRARRDALYEDASKHPLRNVYMVGDNPESDIRGANDYVSPFGSKWTSVLVETGVFSGGEPSAVPVTIAKNVQDAVRWGMKRSGWANAIG